MIDSILQTALGWLGLDVVKLALVLFIINSGLVMTQTVSEKIRLWLESFMDKTETSIDNKAHSFIMKVLGFIPKILKVLEKSIDIIGANRQHVNSLPNKEPQKL